MGNETGSWYNNNILYGFSEKRGLPWWFDASEQSDESTIYPGAVPISDILRRLFNFRAVVEPVFYRIPATMEDAEGLDDSGEPYRWKQFPGRGAVLANDNWDGLHIHSDSYNPHQYPEWLLDNVAAVLRERDLEIGAAGLLDNRAIAWVSVEMPETLTTVTGVEFRPHFLAATSLNGKMPSIWKNVETLTICDNTLAMAKSEKGGEVLNVRHTKNSSWSDEKAEKAQEALGILETDAADFAAKVDSLVNWSVTDEQWESVLSALVPDSKTKTGQTVSAKKRDVLREMYNADNRVAPWKGTAFGIFQAFNTWENHTKSTKTGTIRLERNMMDLFGGNAATADNRVLAAIKQFATVN